MPVSLTNLNKFCKGDQTMVCVSTITNDAKLFDLKKMNVVALHFTEVARARIEAAGGRCLTFDQLLRENPTCANCNLI